MMNMSGKNLQNKLDDFDRFELKIFAGREKLQKDNQGKQRKLNTFAPGGAISIGPLTLETAWWRLQRELTTPALRA